jgi:succinate dehydrogenase/fumarate reductase cytochrome b subunit (b558 family)
MSQMPLGEAVHDVTQVEAVSLLRRVHGLNGVFVLAGYTCLHVVQGFTAFVSREAWVDRVSLFPLANAATIVVLAGLVAHLVTAVLLARAPHDDPTAVIQPVSALGLRRLQQVTGLVLLGFLCVHVAHLWPLTRNEPVLARDGYVALSLWLETPTGLAFYVVATTALAFHLSHGLSRVAVSLGFVTSQPGLRVARYVAGTLGIVMWCFVLHWVGHFANGVGLWPITGEEDPDPIEFTPAQPKQTGGKSQ